MKRPTSIRAVRSFIALAALMLTTGALTAQTTGDGEWARWWYGAYGGANYNLFSGELHDLTADLIGVGGANGFNGGSGLGLAIGGLLEYNSRELLGGNLFIGYDNRAVTFDDIPAGDGIPAQTLSTSLAYVSIEPNLRINLGSPMFHLMLGPHFGINVAKGFEYARTDTSTTTTAGDLANVRSFVLGGQAGVGYDIPLTTVDSRPQVLLTPFAQFHFAQSLIEAPTGSANDYAINTIRAGIEIKFGSPASAVVPPVVVATDFTVRAPSVITDSRRLQETFPLRNYIFFDQGSIEIPERYRKLSPQQAAGFREEQLIRPTVETGAVDPAQVRSRRQMDVYYNALNVFGDRMRRMPNATIKLVGAANGDAAAGKTMAERVKAYLVNAYGIEGSRITTEGRAMPPHKSGSGGSQGEDRRLIDAENIRVEIEGNPPELLRPVNIQSMQEEPIDNDVVVSIPGDAQVQSWSVAVAERGGTSRTFGPYTGQRIARIDSKQLLGTKKEGRYTATVTMTMADGTTTTGEAKEFRLVRSDEDTEQTGNRYSTLFEFDESKTIDTYRDFLMKTVAPAIPDGASVIIHGHTDLIGEPDYNQKLSQRRSDAAQTILQQELTRLGRKVTFDTYGFGEDERRSPFNNNLPEQRYYNRTVVIEVIPNP